MFVKPKAGVLVRDPVTLQHLPESGRDVEPSSYWQRRQAAGDVVVLDSIPISDSAETP